MSITQSATIAVGIFIGLVWSRRTGWSCGGIITPGLLALHLDSPLMCAAALAVGAVLAVPLRIIKDKFCLYGRERIGAAMLLAILVKIIFPLGDLWLGWVIPGLIAADVERQGFFMTMSGAVACAVTAKFVVMLFGVVS